MGQPKALLPWGEKTLLAYQLDELAAGIVDEVIVVLGAYESELRPIVERYPRARAVLNPDYQQGKTTSIKAGIRAAHPSAGHFMVIAVDQPRPRGILAALLGHHLATGALITAPTHEGRRGHPLLFRADLREELLTIREETLGLREVMLRHAAEVIELETGSPVVRLDVNSPEEYEEARRLFGLIA